MRSKKSIGIILFVTTLLLLVTIMDMVMVFRQTRQQTKDSGIYQLESISGELKSTINDAENLTMELAIATREYLDDRQALEDFIYQRKASLLAEKKGAFNLFVAGTGWSIIPDFEAPKGFVATDRVWYKGAVRERGKTYVSPPYQDAMTGNICYSVSVMLGDGDTVLGVDYTMENIQNHISENYSKEYGSAVIVTGEGIIAGCSDESLIGEKLVQKLPDYAGIWTLSKSTEEVATARIKAEFLYDNLFATKSGNGWYLIVSQGDWEMYRTSYLQLIATALLSLLLFLVIIILFIFMMKSQRNLEGALAAKEKFLNDITGELREPLNRILSSSSRDKADTIENYDEEMSRIHAAGEKLSEMIGQILSYSSIVKTEKEESHNEKMGLSLTMNKRFRTVILFVMVVVMLISLYSNISSTLRWGRELLQRETEKYEYQLSEWINTQKSILDMFVSMISTNPEMLEDYEGTIHTLNEITVQYPEISVTYMTNPNLEHTVYMNNGWEPEADWHVEERQWYIDTLASESGWSISAPYYDEQTGGYCVTISEMVIDAKSGEFLGIFGIDFFMDKLVQILGDSYSDTGYAFLVDTEGDIINHPYGNYQMSQENKTNVSDLSYSKIRADGKSTTLIRDYDGRHRILIAARNELSSFIIYVVSSVWVIYGRVLLYGFICGGSFIVCIIMVYRLLTNLIKWQDKTNLKIKASADAAIAAGKAKSQFLAQMSHEIRTPINAVLGMNEMILRESQDEDILDYAGNIQAAGRTLLSIINSILDFSKIEDGKMEIIPVKYDVASTINNLVHSISERAKQKSLEFEVLVDEKIPSILLGDDVRLSQVIMNLLTNAVKYTEKGKVTLSIRIGAKDGDFIYLDVRVKDTGIGIKEEDMGKLFESFERLEEKRNRNIEGTGLGMSIVTKLLGMMDSELKVSSVYGKGSEFSFRIRQSIIDPQPIGDYSLRLEKSKQMTENLTHVYAPKASVLVVDDNDMNRKVIRNLLKINGIVPDQAASGLEAMDKIASRFYDIVFLDHMMPHMDGIETLKLLREKNMIPQGMTVIALTANAVVGARETYLEAGFDDYLSKPVEVEKLEEKIAKYLPQEYVTWKSKEVEQDTVQEEVLEFAPQGEAKEEILEFQPQGQDEAEVLVFEPQMESEDEILEFAPTEKQKGSLSKDEILTKVQALGIETEAGLCYCAGDKAFYIEMLQDFTNSFQDKFGNLQNFFEGKEWIQYETAVHALKSNLKIIGAMELSENARLLEFAAKELNAAYLELNHASFLQEYQTLAEKLVKII